MDSTTEPPASWFTRTCRALTFGFGRRLALAFGLLLCVFVAAAIYFNLQLQLELIRQRLDARAEHLGKLVVDVTASYLYDMRLSDLEIIYADLRRQPDIDYVFVVDEDNIELASGGVDSEATFLGRVEDGLVDEVKASGQVQRKLDLDVEHVGIPVKLGTQSLGILRFGIALDDYNRDLRIVWVRNLIVGVCFVLLGILLSTFLARRLTEPLGNLIAMTDRASRGNLNQFIDLKTNDEFEHLATSFNRMLDALRKSMEEVHQLAFQDKLTSLPNRAWFHEHLERSIADVRRSNQPAALIFLDLDRFKHVNDTLGHHVGDQLLAAFATRLQTCVRQSDAIALGGIEQTPAKPADERSAAVARLGGDEFTILLSRLTKVEDAAIVAERIIASLAEPFELGDDVFVASTSIGIAIFPADGDTVDDLLKHADAAMYQAKQAGRNTYRFYDAAIAEIAIQRLSLEREMRRAIEQDQLELVFQPQTSIRSGDIVAVEALVRWQHPRAGLLTPDKFLSIAEEAGLMPDIGRTVIRKALLAALDWPSQQGCPLRLAINLSIKELEAEGFGDEILRHIDDVGFDPERLEIEVTEGTAMVDSDRVEQQVGLLRSAGIRFAVDDFGIGYSNLARLKRLAFETLKIDESLMRDVGSDRESEILVASILSMANSLRIDVVAEGIETEEQLAFLRQHGCSYAQGRLLAPPLSHQAFLDLIRSDDVAPGRTAKPGQTGALDRNQVA
ncbi:MAG: putative bifunctional diguanylate cyclase/phosphodiesterase [Geminicoccaceae bacterium]